ncbi:MAG: LCP family protein [Clostridia bacterium]|nr:LCP family protein [Clostridia bacterium]
MAKDRRNKVRPRMDLDAAAGHSDDTRDMRSTGDSGSTSRSGSSDRKRTDRKSKRSKKKLSRAALVLRCVAAVLVIAVLIFLFVLGNYIYQAVFLDDRDKVPPISATSYDVTPAQNQGKVAYYLIGVLGENDRSDMSMIAVLCHDKQAQTASLLQLPADTYIETGEQWIVDTASSIWANPKPFDWCDACKKRVYEPEIDESGDVAKHTVCGGEITQKAGSAINSLVDFVNDQLALPVDGYFILPQKGLQILIDSLGGVDVNLSDDLTLAGEDLTSGIHTLTGAQATEYVTYTDGTVERDLRRLARQREVFAAIATRLLRLDKDTLADDVIEEVMDSSGAMRTEYSEEEIVKIIQSMANVGAEKTTAYRLPGEIASDSDGDSVFTCHKDELVALLGNAFNPYGEAITAADVTLPELINTGVSDQKQQLLSDCMTDQTGKILVTNE